MGIRETLNQNQGITIGAAIGVIVLALIFIMRGLWGDSGGGIGDDIQQYYTVDEGQTFFADDATKLPPFDKDGKQAVIAYVYSCDGGKTKFVGYMERYTPEAKKRLEEARTKGTIEPMEGLDYTGKEVRRPADKVWLRISDPRAQQIMDVKCPPGQPQEKLELMYPD